MAKTPIIIAVLGVALALLGTQISRTISENKKTRFDGTFESVAPDLWREGYHWVAMGGLMGVDVYVFLMRIDGGHILVDAGAPTDEAADLLLNNLKKVMGDGELKLIVLTHGHPDHAGMLTTVAHAHPQAQIAFHEDEAPFILGQKAYGELPADTLAFKAFSFNMPASNFSEAVPASRALLLRGKSGDLADARGPAGTAAKWLPPKGVISWHHVPGHAPGQVAFIHKPSKSLLTADVISHMAFKKGEGPKPSLPPSAFSWNTTQGRLDALHLASLSFTRAYPSHDHAMGLSKTELDAFAASL
ncbi:g7685 [Coccomyxa viridis]|uniref:G7685 protein n=1 Tax=Coccomyxa viridis TaxID=1274662 RepID=A0ABP1FYG7_9CHLO